MYHLIYKAEPTIVIMQSESLGMTVIEESEAGSGPIL